MRFKLAALLLATLGPLATPAAVLAAPLSGEAAPLSTIAVTGTGRISRSPDLATVALTIVTNDPSADRALSENNQRFAALSSKLATAGIAASDVKSASISSYYNPRPANPASDVSGQLYGSVVTRSVEVDVTTLGMTGSVVDSAVAAGATQINGISYGFRDRPTIERAALAAAVADANAQAQTIAAAAHVTIVRVLHIGTDGAPPILRQPLMAMARVAQAEPTAIAPTDQLVTSSVSVTYVVK